MKTINLFAGLFQGFVPTTLISCNKDKMGASGVIQFNTNSTIVWR